MPPSYINHSAGFVLFFNKIPSLHHFPGTIATPKACVREHVPPLCLAGGDFFHLAQCFQDGLCFHRSPGQNESMAEPHSVGWIRCVSSINQLTNSLCFCPPADNAAVNIYLTSFYTEMDFFSSLGDI